MRPMGRLVRFSFTIHPTKGRRVVRWQQLKCSQPMEFVMKRVLIAAYTLAIAAVAVTPIQTGEPNLNTSTGVEKFFERIQMGG
jgi:hypothetical protein